MGRSLELRRRGAVEMQQENAAIKLHNTLVKASQAPTGIPEPRTIQFELNSMRGLTKTPGIGLAMGALLFHCENSGEKQFVDDLDPVLQSIHNLKTQIKRKQPREMKVLDELFSSIHSLGVQGIDNYRSLPLARDVLASFKEAMDLYQPTLPAPEEIQKELQRIEEEGVKFEMPGEGVDSPKRRRVRHKNKDIFIAPPRGAREYTDYDPSTPDFVDDKADLHKAGNQRIFKFDAPPLLPEPLTEDELTRDSTTITKRLLAEGNGSPFYGLSILYKGKYKWHRVHLSKPLAPEDFDPRRHVAAQMQSVYTTDLPSEPTQIALVAEAAPWHYDTPWKKVMDTVRVEMPDQSAKALLKFLSAQNINILDVFNIDPYLAGLPGEIKFKRDAAQMLMERIKEQKKASAKKLLSQKITANHDGLETFSRYYLGYTLRMGVPGNDGTTPLEINIRPEMTSEVVKYSKKPTGYEKKDKKKKTKEPPMSKEVKRAKAREQRNRSAIMRQLGITDAKDKEVYFFDNITTSREQEQQGEHATTATSSVKKQDIVTRPLARHESGVEEPSDRIRVQLVPYLFSDKVSRPFHRTTEIDSLESLLAQVAKQDNAVGFQSHPEIKISSSILRTAYNEAKAQREAEVGETPFYGRQDSIKSAGNGAYASGGTTVRGVSIRGSNIQDHGTTVIDSGRAIKQLPPVEIVMVTSMQKAPPTPKRSARVPLLV